MRNTLWFSLLFAMGMPMIGMSSEFANDGAGSIPTVTRLVSIFSKLESDLIEAVDAKDVKAASKLLRDDFEMRVSVAPGSPVPRAAWLKQSLAEPKSSSTIDQLSVHDTGNAAIVSYSWKNKLVGAKAKQDIFVVDVWMRDSNVWKLAVRYAGPAAQNGSHVPGETLSAPGFEKME
jgi:ketosteroid isomerase-like protein